MGGVLSGFVVVGGIVAVGFLLGRFGILGDNGREVLARLAFFVASPALLFQLLSQATFDRVFSPVLLVTVLATVASAVVFIAVGAVRRWGVARTTIGAMCSSYVNAGNLGIPIAAYVLGDPAIMAPVILFQLLLYAPAAVSVIDVAVSGRTSFWQLVTTPLRNPIVVGAVLGIADALTDWALPGPLADAVAALAGMAVPAMLLAFGISLHGMAVPGRGADQLPLIASVTLKMIFQPALAWLLGAVVFGLPADQVFAVTVIAALPAAQNLYSYAVRYRIAEVLVRDAVLVSTLISPVLLLVVAAVLGP